jgi:hypothetical protein
MAIALVTGRVSYAYGIEFDSIKVDKAQAFANNLAAKFSGKMPGNSSLGVVPKTHLGDVTDVRLP